MGYIFYIMGKSASGKDMIYRRLMEENTLGLEKLVLYTTRPIRAGEADGREYYFTDEATLVAMRARGCVIEERTYETVAGPWTYFTADDGKIDLTARHYLAIGTLESYRKIREWFGADRVIPLYIEVEDGERLMRAIARERQQDSPNYRELCRRFLADAEDFSEENVAAAGITTRFLNDGTPEECCRKVEEYIGAML
ncbi:MAG: guanylate kinase [Lachnospiraceae bacterium]|nr:guanylate kinase [Lachnospiraceae bacterium]